MRFVVAFALLTAGCDSLARYEADRASYRVQFLNGEGRVKISDQPITCFAYNSGVSCVLDERAATWAKPATPTEAP